jgi:SPP1 family predicted phage head-tail adaptor
MTGNPGKKNRKIVIQARTVTNTLGDAVSSWTTLASVWAEERPLRMTERQQSAALHSVETSNFRIYYRDDITPEMQVFYKNKSWKIMGLAEIGNREELDITAEAVY